MRHTVNHILEGYTTSYAHGNIEASSVYAVPSSHYTVSPYPPIVLIELRLLLRSLELLNCMGDEALPCVLLVLPISLFNVRCLSCARAFLNSGATNNAMSLCHAVVERTNLLEAPGV
jgi:hypothetical protein